MRSKEAAFNLIGYMHNLIEAQKKAPILCKEERMAIELMLHGITEAYYILDKALNENIDVAGLMPDNEYQAKIISMDRDTLTRVFQEANMNMHPNEKVHIVKYPDHICVMVSNDFDNSSKVILNEPTDK